MEVAFAEVEILLHAPEADEIISWRTDVGFVPRWQAPFPIVAGQIGFLDQFTVTFHRGAALLAVEPWDAFDARFGVQIRRRWGAVPTLGQREWQRARNHATAEGSRPGRRRLVRWPPSRMVIASGPARTTDRPPVAFQSATTGTSGGFEEAVSR